MLNLNYFIESIPNIESNDELREPQVRAYQAIYDHFIVNKSKEHAIVVLPTGVGKTGLMGILPFGISYGRVLIITPQLVIKDTVLDSLDPEHPKNFWLARKLFENIEELPSVIEYDSKRTDWELRESNLVILNVHKLQERLDKALINRVPQDFFDFIIIDEAHHSTAPTWENAMKHFYKAKIVKLTGTPYRTDGEIIEGEYVYKYPLSQAMAAGYVKSLEKVHYVPDSLFLTLDRNDSTLYSIDQIRGMNLKDEEWITRSVAYSADCNLKVVEASCKLLKEKRRLGVPHKIIAVACSIFHAEELQVLYEKFEMRVALIHSRIVPKELLSTRLKTIENHKVEVVIHVAKLGEGYDHKFLSIAAIFRPFRNRLPYEQFIGRILRSIDGEDTNSIEDNIACVVHHKELGLEYLWEFYKGEKEKSEVIKWIEGKQDSLLGSTIDRKKVERQTGEVFEDGEGRLEKESFINTELMKERERRMKIDHEKLLKLKELLPDYPEDVLLQIIKRQDEGKTSEKILRPDKFISRKIRSLDDRIKIEMVPEIIMKYNIVKEADTLKFSRLLKGKHAWIGKQIKYNAAMLATYLEVRVNEEAGNADRKTWGPEEYEAALKNVEIIYEYIQVVLNSELK